jgi:hypothetical protein
MAFRITMEVSLSLNGNRLSGLLLRPHILGIHC